MKKLLFFACTTFVLSCNQQANNVDSIAVQNDSTKENIGTSDDTIIVALDSNSAESYEDHSTISTEIEIEKTYGKQWDFCDCIKKTDSIQRVIDSEAEISDAKFDLIMTRFDEIDNHCKSIISSPNTTPEERQSHQRRVKNCLKNQK